MSSARQEQVFEFIRDTIEGTSQAPTYQEIGDHFGFSAEYAWKIVDGLVDLGRIKRTKAVARNIMIPDLVDLACVSTERMRAELARRGVTLEALDRPRSFAFSGQDRFCAANHCRTTVQRGMLMCREHWFKLPQRYRTDIMNAWGARQTQAFSEALERARDHLGGYTRVLERAQ